MGMWACLKECIAEAFPELGYWDAVILIACVVAGVLGGVASTPLGPVTWPLFGTLVGACVGVIIGASGLTLLFRCYEKCK
jgi:hypothetical protein